MSIICSTANVVATNTRAPILTDWTAVFKAIGGLASWVDAGGALVDGSGKVLSVLDKSGKGAGYTQATAGKRPSVMQAAVNGQPALTFLSADPDRLDFAGTFPGTGDWTKAIVAKVSSASNPAGELMGTTSGTKSSIYTNGTAYTVANGTGSVLINPFDATKWHLFLAGWSATAGLSFSALDNGPILSLAQTVSGAFNTAMYLGSDSTFATPFDGLIAEAALFTGVNLLDGAHASDLATVQTYFGTRYGLFQPT